MVLPAHGMVHQWTKYILNRNVASFSIDTSVRWVSRVWIGESNYTWNTIVVAGIISIVSIVAVVIIVTAAGVAVGAVTVVPIGGVGIVIIVAGWIASITWTTCDVSVWIHSWSIVISSVSTIVIIVSQSAGTPAIVVIAKSITVVIVVAQVVSQTIRRIGCWKIQKTKKIIIREMINWIGRHSQRRWKKSNSFHRRRFCLPRVFINCFDQAELGYAVERWI